MQGQLVETEHLTRYWFASTYAAGRVALDAGCGLGYGSAALAEAGATAVFGVDISASALEVASQTLPDVVELAEGDVRKLPLPDDSVDLVVCFEVIEHVAEQDEVLDELARVARPEALVLVSSPNRDKYPEGNPHHVREYKSDELRAALAARFANVALVRQYAAGGSVLLTDEHLGARGRSALLPTALGSVLSPAAGEEIYTIALASNAPLPQVKPYAALGSPVEIREWVGHYARQHEQLASQAEALREFDAVNAERRALTERLAEAEQEAMRVFELEHEVAELRAAYNRLLDEYRDVENHLDAARGVIDDVTGSASWRLTMPLRTLKQLARERS
jgi:SAM-dependent methyltransferase